MIAINPASAGWTFPQAGTMDGPTILAAFAIFFGAVVIAIMITNEIIYLIEKKKRNQRHRNKRGKRK